MKVKSQFLFLGTGGSMGIPVIGCTCPVCLSPLSFNKRTRPSALIESEGQRILIDCGPDFKDQALRHNLDHLDGMIITHSHHDHTAGIDELRIYAMRDHHPIPCLLSPEAAADIKRRFHYIFDEDSSHILKQKFAFQCLEGRRGDVVFQGIKLRYFSYEQSGTRVNGFRFGNLAYVTDIRDFSDEVFDELMDLDVLIVSALRFTPSPVHLSIDEAVDFSRRTGAKETWLMHVAHELEHEKTNAYLPRDIQLAYDGRKLEFYVER